MVQAHLEFPKDFAVVECSLDRPGAVTNLTSVLNYISSNLQASSGKGHFNVDMNAKFNNFCEAEIPVEDLKPLLRIVLSSLVRLGNPDVRRRVGVLWRALAQKGTKTHHEGCFACLTAASKRTESSTSLATLFEWSCILASASAFSEGGTFSGTSFAKLASLQFGLLGRIYSTDSAKKQQKRSISIFQLVLSRNNGALSQYIQVASNCQDTSEVIGAASAIIPFACTQGRITTEIGATAKQTFIKIYSSAVLAATEGRDGRRPPASLTAAFDPLFKNLSHDEFSALLPEMCRILRRTPELYFKSLAHSISSLGIDTSRYVSQFSAVLCERLLSETMRDDALLLVASLAMQSSDTSSLVAIGGDIHKTLMGKGSAGAIKTWQERLGLVSALQSLISTPKGKGMSPLASELVPNILSLADKEANDTTKCVAVRLFGLCLRRAESVPADAVKFLAKGLENASDVIRRACLDCLREALQSSEVRPKLQDLISSLGKLIAAAEKKPGMRGDAVIASRLLITML